MDHLRTAINQPQIYKITNLVNGKFYIGKTVGKNTNYICSGLLVHKAIKKYGSENFKKEIIVSGDFNEVLLDELEKHYIRLFNATNKNIAYNINLGGKGGNNVEWTEEKRKEHSKKMTGKVWSEETKKKVSKTLKKMYSSGKIRHSQTNAIWSEKSKEKLSNTLKKKYASGEMKAYKRTEEQLKEFSEKMKGRKLPEEHKIKISEGLQKAHDEGRRNPDSWKKMWSEEARNKKVETQRKQWDSGERKQWNVGIPAHNRKEIIVTTLDGSFFKQDTLKELKIEGCKNGATIRACCKGEIESFNGYIFKWVEK